MKQQQFESLSVPELVEKFAAIGTEQDKALEVDDTAKYNPLFWQMQAVVKELKSRRGDQRRALLALYDHPKMQVRLAAAKATLRVAPGAARQLIEAIAATTWYPQAGDAGMCLWALDKGIFKPE